MEATSLRLPSKNRAKNKDGIDTIKYLGPELQFYGSNGNSNRTDRKYCGIASQSISVPELIDVHLKRKQGIPLAKNNKTGFDCRNNNCGFFPFHNQGKGEREGN